MSSVAVYSSRSRASERTRNIRNDMNRASAYILKNDYTAPSSYSTNNTYSTPKVTRRPRDSSCGTLGRPNRESSLTRTSTYARESSLPRYKESHVALKPTAPTSLITSIISNRHSIAIPVLDSGLGSETAKYNRQNELKEIHNSFMKGFKDTNTKLNGDKAIAPDDQGERRTKAYSKIIGDQAGYASEMDYQRHNYSEMFIDTGKFSTRTLSAINNLDGAVLRQKKRDPGDYQWRKDLEQYEKSSEYEKEKRIRNIASTTRQRIAKDDTDGKENQKNMSTQNKSRNTLLNINKNIESSAKPPQSPKAKPKVREVPKPETKREPVATPNKITKPTKPVIEEEIIEPEPPRKSWRERAAEKEKAETKKSKEVDDEEEQERKNAQEMARSIRAKIEAQLEEAPPEPVKRPKRTPRKKTDLGAANEELRKLIAASEESNPRPVKSSEKQTDVGAANEELRKLIAASDAANEKAYPRPKPNADTDTEKNEEGSENKDESTPEEDDLQGTKKMQSDFDAKMLALEAEMKAGSSKLAKIRERIRKAKGTCVKTTDTASDDSKKS